MTAVGNASLEADRGKFKESFRWLELAREIGVDCRQKSAAGYLSGRACDAMTLRQLHLQVGKFYNEPEFVKLARKFCEDAGPLPSMRDAIVGEIWRLPALEDSLAKARTDWGGFESDEPSSFQLAALRFPSTRRQIIAICLADYREALQSLGEGASFTKDREVAIRLDRSFTEPISTEDELAGFFTPRLGLATGAILGNEVYRRTALQALELFIHKAKHGALPVTLDATKPYAIDPFNDKPLCYRVKGAAFKLYSVGPNLRDDGGPKITASGITAQNDDVAFYLP